jgi:hypothetical protein
MPIPQKNLFVELHIGLYSWNLLLAEDAKLKELRCSRRVELIETIISSNEAARKALKAEAGAPTRENGRRSAVSYF